MIVATALLSFGVSCWAGHVFARHVRRRIGPSLKEWTGPTGLGSDGGKLLGAVFTLAGAVGFEGFLGPPAVLRAALLGMAFGFCTPLFIEGMRRHARDGKEQGPRESTRADAGRPL
jgi:hypothetical protein